MKVLVTGANGQLGYDVVKMLALNGHCPYGAGRAELDITDRGNVDRVFEKFCPDAVIHCAAWTDVDAAQCHPAQAYKVNVTGTENLAYRCRVEGIKFLYISTDYVFSGKGENAWEPDVSPIEPVNVYGSTKYKGEIAVKRSVKQSYIVRVSWLFGKHGNNFVKTMLEKGRTRDRLAVVGDQIGSPTYTRDLAELLVKLLESENFGTYHVSGEGWCSRYEFACEIFRQMAERGYKEYDADHLCVQKITTEDYRAKAKRPLNSRLNTEKLIEKHFYKLPDWKDALGRYLDELGY